MSQPDLSRVFPGWSAEGILGTGDFGTVYLIRNAESGAFSAMRQVKMPPHSEAIENAVKLGIGRDLLVTYFTKFKNDLNWELAMAGNIRCLNLASVEEVKCVDNDGPGWTGYIRTGIYTPLSTYFEKTPATGEDAARLGTDIASALDALCQYGLVHGEVKPSNVMVTDGGSYVLTDYALRRTLEKAGSGIFGASADEFAAPETLGQEREYTARSDIYSLGAVMCYVANGCAMPENGDPDNIPDIHKGLAAVIKRAMAPDPAARYQTAAQIKLDLARLGLVRRQPRRAMAAAAAFDAVKRNGGAVMTGPAYAAAASGAAAAASGAAAVSGNRKKGQNAPKKQQAEPARQTAPARQSDPVRQTEPVRQAEPVRQTAPAQPTASDRQDDGYSQDSGKDANPGTYVFTDEIPARNDLPTVKRSKMGWLIAFIALLAIAAVILFLWTPWKKDDAGTGGEDEQHGTLYPEGMDKDALGNDVHGGPGTTSGGNTGSGEGTQSGADDGDTDSGGGDASGEDTGTTGGNTSGEDGSGGAATAPDGDTDGGGDTQSDTGSNGEDDAQGGEGADGQETNPDGSGTTGGDAEYSEYLYPSDTVRITRAELEGMSRADSSRLINEIYARHGYIFGGEGSSNQQYFSSKSWYTPVTKDASQVEKQFNAVETANIKTLVDYQKEMGWRGGGSSSGDSSEGSEGSGTANPDATDNTFLFPSDTQLITREDLEGKTQRDVQLLVNEIYARHGYIFKTDFLKEYFENQQWYKPVTSSNSVVYSSFNDTEKKNAVFLDEYMKEQGWR